MTATPIIETQRLILRKPDITDTDAVVRFLMSDRARYVGGPVAHSRAWRAFAGVVGHWDLRGFGMFSIVRKDCDRAIGWAGPFFPGEYREVELSWSIWSNEDEGKGYAYEAALAARDYAYHAMGLDSLVSFIDAENARSIALAKRLGAVEDKDAFDPYAERDDVGEGVVFRHLSADSLDSDGSVEAYA